MPKRKSQIPHAQIVRRFSEKLRELRLSRGMTQSDLGQAAQVTGSYVGRLEAGGYQSGNRSLGAIGDCTRDNAPRAFARRTPPTRGNSPVTPVTSKKAF